MRKFLLIMMCFLLLSPLCLSGCKDPGYNGTIIIPNEPNDTQNNSSNSNNSTPDTNKPQDSKPNDDNKTPSDNASDNKPNENNPDIYSPDKPNDDNENADDQDKEESQELFSKGEIDKIVNLVKQVCNKLNYLQGVEPAVALTNENLRIVFCDDNFTLEQNAALTPSLIETFEKENLDVKTNLFDGILTIYIKKIT